MDLEETMVEQPTETEELPELVEETDESEEESLESVLDDGQPEEEKPQEQASSEPGWIKKRVEKAVNKAVAEALAQQKAQFDAEMAPIKERMLNDEAEKLVKQGIVKDLDTARELVRYRQNVPQAEKETQPRNEKGQFTASDPGVKARIEMLQHQADVIKEKGGPDVITEFMNNEEIKKKVKSGEMDFYDVAEFLKTPKKQARAPVRSPNGASGYNQNVITQMSDEQFKRMQKNIEKGARYTLR